MTFPIDRAEILCWINMKLTNFLFHIFFLHSQFYQYGGIYLDTDVELIRSLDELLETDGYIGFEKKVDEECDEVYVLSLIHI